MFVCRLHWKNGWVTLVFLIDVTPPPPQAISAMYIQDRASSSWSLQACPVLHSFKTGQLLDCISSPNVHLTIMSVFALTDKRAELHLHLHYDCSAIRLV